MNRFFDFRYAIRLLMNRPGFSVLVMVVLAMATALSLFMLSFIHTVAYKALPFPDGEDIVIIDGWQDGIMLNGGHMNPLDLEEIRQSVPGLEEFVLSQDSYSILSGRDSARTYMASRIGAGMFQLTRTEPVLGRAFTEAEVRAGGEEVVVISHDVWQNYFGGAGNVIDQMVRINGESTRVIGVMPPGFRFHYTSDLWLPLRLDLDRVTRGSGVNALALARLAQGANAEDVQTAGRHVMSRLSEAYPETNERMSVYITTIPLSSMGQGMVFVVSAWVTAILLVVLAAINVGNLLLSRALERGKETAIRLALGAPRSRLIMQMMWESTIIIGVGAGAGLLLAAWGLDAVNLTATRFIDGPSLFWWRFGLDAFVWSMFGWMVVGMLLLAGLLPAVRAATNDFNATLRDGARASISRKEGRLSHWLVVAECLLSVTILIAAGVLVVNSYLSARADYGADPGGIYTARVNLPENRYPGNADWFRFAEDLRSTLGAKGGVRSVAIMSSIPGTAAWTPTYEVEGFEYGNTSQLPRGSISSVLPGSMAILGMELLHGRFFDSRDRAAGLDVMIVSEATAKKHWPGVTALGQRLRVVDSNLPDGHSNRGAWHTVVGVVRQTIHGQPFGSVDEASILYVPFAQQPTATMYVAYSYPGDLPGAMRTLDAALMAVDQDIPAFGVLSYKERINRNVAAMIFLSQLFMLFGLVAVVLVGSGIYGVVSNTITQRTQEIGIKRALGASEARVFRDFFAAAGRQLSLGIVPGTLLGGTIGWQLANTLKVDNGVLITIIVAMPLLLTGIILLATWVPTRRVLQMEPGDALRHE